MRLITKLRRAAARSSPLVLPVEASTPSVTGRTMGALTLPVPVEWSQRVLPAGAYVFVVSAAPSPSWVYVRGNDDATVFFAAGSEPAPGSPRNEVGLRYDGRRYHVRSLTLRATGTTLLFDLRPEEPAGTQEARGHGVLYVLLQPFPRDSADGPRLFRRHESSALHHRASRRRDVLLSTSDPWRPR
jgi:hypothetical protein